MKRPPRLHWHVASRFMAYSLAYGDSLVAPFYSRIWPYTELRHWDNLQLVLCPVLGMRPNALARPWGRVDPRLALDWLAAARLLPQDFAPALRGEFTV